MDSIFIGCVDVKKSKLYAYPLFDLNHLIWINIWKVTPNFIASNFLGKVRVCNNSVSKFSFQSNLSAWKRYFSSYIIFELTSMCHLHWRLLITLACKKNSNNKFSIFCKFFSCLLRIRKPFFPMKSNFSEILWQSSKNHRNKLFLGCVRFEVNQQVQCFASVKCF